MSKAPKPVFVCQECGSQASKWLGRCPDCEAWNSFVEERPIETSAGLGGAHRYSLPGGAQGARRYADIALSDTPRLTGLPRTMVGTGLRYRHSTVPDLASSACT